MSFSSFFPAGSALVVPDAPFSIGHKGILFVFSKKIEVNDDENDDHDDRPVPECHMSFPPKRFNASLIVAWFLAS